MTIATTSVSLSPPFWNRVSSIAQEGKLGGEYIPNVAESTDPFSETAHIEELDQHYDFNGMIVNGNLVIQATKLGNLATDSLASTYITFDHGSPFIETRWFESPIAEQGVSLNFTASGRPIADAVDLGRQSFLVSSTNSTLESINNSLIATCSWLSTRDPELESAITIS